MNHPIRSIRITNVRGIRGTKLPVDGCSLILVGENGSGKSSIVDAIEYFFTGHVDHLEGRQDVSMSTAFPHIKGGSTEVILEWGNPDSPDTVKASFPEHQLAIPQGMQVYFTAASSRAFILRRAQLLNFINARDGDRYEQISSIIGLDDLDSADEALRTQLNDEKKTSQQAGRSLQELQKRIASLLKVRRVSSESEILTGLNMLLESLGVDKISTRNEIPERQKVVEQLCQSSEDREKLQRIRAAKALTARIAGETSRLTDLYSALLDSSRQLIALTSQVAEASLEQFLREAVTVLDEELDKEQCPLCGAPIDRIALLMEVRMRLKVLTEVTACRQDVNRKRVVLRDALANWTTDLEHLAGELEQLHQGERLQTLRRSEASGDEWRNVLEKDDLADHIALGSKIDTISAALHVELAAHAQELDRMAEELSPDQTQSAAFELLSTLQRVDELWVQLQAELRKYKVSEYVTTQIDLVYQALLQARHRGLQRIATDLQEDFAYLYSQLHPDEGCGNITLTVAVNRRASVGLRVGFFTQDGVQPLNYFSEGHLDSLGLCVFLAFIRRFNSDFRLIVLDDIWTAVDAGHRLRVAQLLRKEFSDHQIIVTTHDRLWAEHLNIVLPNSMLYRLRPWNLELGTCCQQIPPSDWEYYREQINDGRAQDAIAGVGRNLERFLYLMRGNLGIAVPATRNDNYTIGHLYGPFFKWMKKHRPIVREDWSGFDDDIQAMDEELDSVWRLRNWSGAHFNEWATQVSRREALDFLNAVEELVSAFSCPVCGDLVIYDEDIQVLRCPNCQPSRLPRFVPQYKSDWPAGVDRMLAGGDPRAIAGVGPKLTGVLQRFLADMFHYLSLELDEEVGGLATRYAYLLVWAHQHPREDVPGWADVVSTMEQTFHVYWQEPQGTVIPDEAKTGVFRVISKFTGLFTCTACNNLLRYHSERQSYYCPECEKQVQPVQRVSAYWYTGRT